VQQDEQQTISAGFTAVDLNIMAGFVCMSAGKEAAHHEGSK
jgi:hypothetical protein